MKYALMRKMDISNGRNIGVSLFTQGCRAHCYNCFNPETWSFDDGKEWDDDAKETFLKLASADYVKRISILGGEPLEPENLCDILNLLKEIRQKFPDKTIWLYTGFTLDQIFNQKTTCESNSEEYEVIKMRQEIIKMCDVVVDGRYLDELRDITGKWCGSTNQRVIDIQQSIEQNKLALYN